MQTTPKILSKKDILEILEDRLKGQTYTKLSHIPEPFLFKGMREGATRICSAIKNREKIVIIGDYDVDGVVSCAILRLFFEEIGVDIKCIIPNRFDDGYGISPEIINRVEADLIITVDNGIVAFEAANLCRAKGIDLIITDHHIPQERLPEAIAVINPKQNGCRFPFKEVCGAHIAWYLAAAIKSSLKIDIDLKKYLDLLSIAIIADVMPLLELNRLFVKYGLREFEKKNRVSTMVMLKNLGKDEVSSEDISFFIAPRINSAGRMDSAEVALEFLCQKDPNKAQLLYEKLEETNKARREIEEEILNHSISFVKEGEDMIFAWGEDWHEGVVGIVASRLMQKYDKPAAVMSIKNGIAKGSGRGTKGFDIFGHFEKKSDLLIKFGGHKGAIGFSLEERHLNNLVETLRFIECSNVSSEKNEEVLGEISPNDIDMELLEILYSFEPYGEHYPKPIFFARDLKVLDCKMMGKDQRHKSILVDYKNIQRPFWILAFKNDDKIKINENINIYFTLSKNIYNNRISPKILVEKLFKL